MEGQSTQLWATLRGMFAGVLPGVGSAADTKHTPDRCLRTHRGDNQQVSIRSSTSHCRSCISAVAEQLLRKSDLPA